MSAVQRWTGREADALRAALRLSIRAYAEYLGVSTRTVGQWHSRGVRLTLRPDMQSVLDTALDRASGGAKARFSSILGLETAESGLGIGRHASGETSFSAEIAAARAAAFAVWAEATNVGPMNIQRFEAETRRLAKDYLSRPPAPIFARTARLARTAFDLIQHGHQHLSQTRDLYVAAGRLSALLSWISGDLGYAAAAAEQARVAWLCAEQAGQPALRAWAMSVASKAAYWDGDFYSAVGCARNGQLYAATGTALVMLACQEADALKSLGRILEAEDAIKRARTLREQVNTTDDIGGLFSCGPARQANYEVSVQVAAAQPRLALGAATEAEEAFASGDQWAYGTWAQVKFGAALAHIAMDNVDGAAEQLQPVLTMPPDRRLATLVHRAGEVTGMLTSPRLAGSRVAKELAGRIDDYRRSPLPLPQAPSRGLIDDSSRDDA